jgi:glycosyltransferase involved in cell wall biosynthesis
MTGASALPTIAVAICTYNRNDALANLLEALLACVAHLAEKGAVGVVVVDDSADGKARQIVERFEGRFELGIVYRISGRQNISLARNIAIETASEMAMWTAMTDDDCEPVPEWLDELLAMQQRTGADAVTGPMIRRVPPGSPRWVTDEPFLELGLVNAADGSEASAAATHNSMISSKWLRAHPKIRFDPAFGVIGGEDMVFYRSAHAAGLQIHFAQQAVVHENETPERTTLSYQLRSFFWHGNSIYVTMVHAGVHPVRMFIHALNSLRKAIMRPVGRLCRGQHPQLRFCLALVMLASGKMIGPLGIRIKHR